MKVCVQAIRENVATKVELLCVICKLSCKVCFGDASLIFLHHTLLKGLDFVFAKVIFTLSRDNESLVSLFELLVIVPQGVNFGLTIVVGAKETSKSVHQLVLKGSSIISNSLHIGV